MNRYKIELQSPNSVVAGQRAAFSQPTDVRYHKLVYEYSNNASPTPNQAAIEADIDLIEVKAKGRVRRLFTPHELFTINAARGKAFVNGQIVIYFSENNGRTAVDEDALAWGMADVDNFEVYFHLNAAANAPALSGWASVDEVQEPFEGIVEWRSANVDVTATGSKKFKPDVQKDREVVKAIHLFEAADGDISRLRVSVDRLEIFNLTAARNALDLADEGFTDQNALFSYRPDMYRRIENYLPLVKENRTLVHDFTLEATMAQASSFTYQMELWVPKPA